MTEHPPTSILSALAHVAEVVDVEDTTREEFEATQAKFLRAALDFIATFEDASRERGLDGWDLLPRLGILEEQLHADSEIDNRVTGACSLVREWVAEQRRREAVMNRADRFFRWRGGAPVLHLLWIACSVGAAFPAG